MLGLYDESELGHALYEVFRIVTTENHDRLVAAFQEAMSLDSLSEEFVKKILTIPGAAESVASHLLEGYPATNDPEPSIVSVFGEEMLTTVWPSIERCISVCLAHLNSEFVPEDADLQSALLEAYCTISKTFAVIPTETLNELASIALEGGYTAALLELLFGKGTVEALLESVDVFCKTLDARNEKDEMLHGVGIEHLKELVEKKLEEEENENER